MLSLQDQLDRGSLVCPVTHRRLSWRGSELVTDDGVRRYAVVDGVPLLNADPRRQESYRLAAGGRMYTEYLQRERSRLRRVVSRLGEMRADYRSRDSAAAFAAVTSEMPETALCLSIGGGPGRPHPCLTNLNIDLFPNVDVVADAYALPYADGSVDAVHCEAVLEHLETPERAVAEMLRVLRAGGLAYLATPLERLRSRPAAAPRRPTAGRIIEISWSL